LRAEGHRELPPSEWVRTRLGIDLDPIQERILDSEAQQILVNCTRHWGKSTIAAARAVLEADRVPWSLILVASPGGRQSGEMVLKARQFT
jgi:hypothetical protein